MSGASKTRRVAPKDKDEPHGGPAPAFTVSSTARANHGSAPSTPKPLPENAPPPPAMSSRVRDSVSARAKKPVGIGTNTASSGSPYSTTSATHRMRSTPPALSPAPSKLTRTASGPPSRIDTTDGALPARQSASQQVQFRSTADPLLSKATPASKTSRARAQSERPALSAVQPSRQRPTVDLLSGTTSSMAKRSYLASSTGVGTATSATNPAHSTKTGTSTGVDDDDIDSVLNGRDRNSRAVRRPRSSTPRDPSVATSLSALSLAIPTAATSGSSSNATPSTPNAAAAARARGAGRVTSAVVESSRSSPSAASPGTASGTHIEALLSASFASSTTKRSKSPLTLGIVTPRARPGGATARAQVPLGAAPSSTMMTLPSPTERHSGGDANQTEARSATLPSPQLIGATGGTGVTSFNSTVSDLPYGSLVRPGSARGPQSSLSASPRHVGPAAARSGDGRGGDATPGATTAAGRGENPLSPMSSRPRRPSRSFSADVSKRPLQGTPVEVPAKASAVSSRAHSVTASSRTLNDKSFPSFSLHEVESGGGRGGAATVVTSGAPSKGEASRSRTAASSASTSGVFQPMHSRCVSEGRPGSMLTSVSEPAYTTKKSTAKSGGGYTDPLAERDEEELVKLARQLQEKRERLQQQLARATEAQQDLLSQHQQHALQQDSGSAVTEKRKPSHTESTSQVKHAEQVGPASSAVTPDSTTTDDDALDDAVETDTEAGAGDAQPISFSDSTGHSPISPHLRRRIQKQQQLQRERIRRHLHPGSRRLRTTPLLRHSATGTASQSSSQPRGGRSSASVSPEGSEATPPSTTSLTLDGAPPLASGRDRVTRVHPALSEQPRPQHEPFGEKGDADRPPVSASSSSFSQPKPLRKEESGSHVAATSSLSSSVKTTPAPEKKEATGHETVARRSGGSERTDSTSKSSPPTPLPAPTASLSPSSASNANVTTTGPHHTADTSGRVAAAASEKEGKKSTAESGRAGGSATTATEAGGSAISSARITKPRPNTAAEKAVAAAAAASAAGTTPLKTSPPAAKAASTADSGKPAPATNPPRTMVVITKGGTGAPSAVPSASSARPTTALKRAPSMTVNASTSTNSELERGGAGGTTASTTMAASSSIASITTSATGGASTITSTVNASTVTKVGHRTGADGASTAAQLLPRSSITALGGDKQVLLPELASPLEKYRTVTIVFDLDETLCNNRVLGPALLRPGAMALLRFLRSTYPRPVYKAAGRVSAAESTANRLYSDAFKHAAKAGGLKDTAAGTKSSASQPTSTPVVSPTTSTAPGVDGGTTDGVRVELVLWTASMELVARPVVARIDQGGCIFDQSIYRDMRWYRSSMYTKELRRLGRPMDRVVIIENAPSSVSLNRRNALLVNDFVSNRQDRQLYVVRAVLEAWLREVDVMVRTRLPQQLLKPQPQATKGNNSTATDSGAAGSSSANGSAQRNPSTTEAPVFVWLDDLAVSEFLHRHPYVSPGTNYIRLSAVREVMREVEQQRAAQLASSGGGNGNDDDMEDDNGDGGGVSARGKGEAHYSGSGGSYGGVRGLAPRSATARLQTRLTAPTAASRAKQNRVYRGTSVPPPPLTPPLLNGESAGAAVGVKGGVSSGATATGSSTGGGSAQSGSNANTVNAVVLRVEKATPASASLHTSGKSRVTPSATQTVSPAAAKHLHALAKMAAGGDGENGVSDHHSEPTRDAEPPQPPTPTARGAGASGTRNASKGSAASVPAVSSTATTPSNVTTPSLSPTPQAPQPLMLSSATPTPPSPPPPPSTTATSDAKPEELASVTVRRSESKSRAAPPTPPAAPDRTTESENGDSSSDALTASTVKKRSAKNKQTLSESHPLE